MTRRVEVIGNATLHLGDCLEVLRTLADNSIDSIVTDPPYGLAFMGKRWDYDVPSQAIWEECLRVLKPGGHLLAFSGSRTYHRMACAIEDAGFEVRDQIMWLYGSGFPKSLDVSKAIDKAAGATGTYGEPKSAAHAGWIDRGRMRGGEGGDGRQRPWMQDETAISNAARKYKPGSDAARQWQGWGTALKPAHEPIVVARKPLVGTVAANVLEYGTGALNIDGCRVAGEPVPVFDTVGGRKFEQTHTQPERRTRQVGTSDAGRWPANVIHDGSDEVMAAFPDAPGQQRAVGPEHGDKPSVNCYVDMGARPYTPPRGDTGSAARFFYCAKASKRDREEGLEHMEAVHRPNGNKWTDQDYRVARGERPPSAESGPRKNIHPTVKPTDLMRYLCRLVTPPGGIVLDHFMGSGSTGKAAMLEGFRFIGIEREPNYFDIACRRIEDAQRQGKLIA